MVNELRLSTLSDVDRLAAALASRVTVPMTLALCGPLGAGKTQLVRLLAAHLSIPVDTVTSPTYVLMQRYRGVIDLIHLDFYRLNSAAEVWDLGLDEWLVEPALTVIEWADKFPQTWPDEIVRCDLIAEPSGERLATFTAHGPRAERWLNEVISIWSAEAQPPL